MEPKAKHRSKCETCPLWQGGYGGVVPPRIVPGASVLAVGQNPGEEEEAAGEPFVGKTGRSLEQNFLVRAGLSREDVSFDNAIRCRWKGTNSLPPLTEAITQQAIAHCRSRWFDPAHGAKLIVSLGDYAAAATAGLTRPAEWRGWLVPQVGTHKRHLTEAWVPDSQEVPVLITVHPARLFREPTLTPAAVRDWQRVKWFLKGTWPRPLPEPRSYLSAWPDDCSFDTEYDRWHTNKLHRYSVSDGEAAWVVEADMHHWPVSLPSHVWMHNSVADLGHLRTLLMAEPAYDDTMLLHSVLASDMPHDLDYLGSLYAPYNRWKHLARVKPRLYAGGDALATWHIAQALKAQLAFDPGSEFIYRKSVLPLVPHILKAQQTGLSVNRPRVTEVLALTRQRCDDAMWAARAATGIGSFNVGSPAQVKTWVYDIET